MDKSNIIKKITEYTVYESPDGGETVYARTSGESNRVKIFESDRVVNIRAELLEARLWYDICKHAQTNPVLQDALDRAILLYHLSKEKENGEK
jgi:hypothetical protein